MNDTMTYTANKKFLSSETITLRFPTTEEVMQGACVVIFTGMTALETLFAFMYFAAGGWYILGGLFFTAGAFLFGAFLWDTIKYW